MRWLAAMLFAYATVLPAQATASDRDKVARMQQVMQSETADADFMGAVLVVKDGAVLLDRGYGDANLEWDIPNTPGTHFHVASLIKQFTAAGVLLLQERGKLRLSDPIKTWLPDAPPAWDGITLFDLLTQTSGIPDYLDAPDFIRPLLTRQVTPDELIASFRDKPLEFPPGAKFGYSSSNYALLGRVIEKAGGAPYARFLKDNILTPLGLKDTGYDSRALLKRRASGYAVQDGAIVNARTIDMSVPYAAGSLYSTTHDLLAWEKALLGGRLLSPASLKTMLTPYDDAHGPGAPFRAGYGMGVYVGTDVDGRREISHTGSSPGFSAMMAAWPDDDLVVIVLGNIETTPFGDIAGKLSDIALGKTVVLPAERKQVAVDATLLARYEGRYRLLPDLAVEITLVGDTLYAQVGKLPPFAILPQGETSFFSRTPDVQVDFQADGGLVWQGNGSTLNGARLP